MAKNVIVKKKRVAHLTNEIDCDEVLCGEDYGLDFLSNIMKDMDSNLKKNVQSNSYTRSKITSIPTAEEDPEKIFRKKKIQLNKAKHPLMEKSQKILKQLKHNQRIPKLRAHVASLPQEFSPKKVWKTSKGATSQVNKQNQVVLRRVGTANKCSLQRKGNGKSSFNKIQQLLNSNNNSNPSMSKSSKATSKSCEKASTKQIDNDDAINNSDIETRDSLNIVPNDFLSNSTDDEEEFERFVRKNTKQKKRKRPIKKKCSTKNNNDEISTKNKTFHKSKDKQDSNIDDSATYIPECYNSEKITRQWTFRQCNRDPSSISDIDENPKKNKKLKSHYRPKSKQNSNVLKSDIDDSTTDLPVESHDSESDEINSRGALSKNYSNKRCRKGNKRKTNNGKKNSSESDIDKTTDNTKEYDFANKDLYSRDTTSESDIEVKSRKNKKLKTRNSLNKQNSNVLKSDTDDDTGVMPSEPYDSDNQDNYTRWTSSESDTETNVKNHPGSDLDMEENNMTDLPSPSSFMNEYSQQPVADDESFIDTSNNCTIEIGLEEDNASASVTASEATSTDTAEKDIPSTKGSDVEKVNLNLVESVEEESDIEIVEIVKPASSIGGNTQKDEIHKPNVQQVYESQSSQVQSQNNREEIYAQSAAKTVEASQSSPANTNVVPQKNVNSVDVKCKEAVDVSRNNEKINSNMNTLVHLATNCTVGQIANVPKEASNPTIKQDPDDDDCVLIDFVVASPKQGNRKSSNKPIVSQHHVKEEKTGSCEQSSLPDVKTVVPNQNIKDEIICIDLENSQTDQNTGNVMEKKSSVPGLLGTGIIDQLIPNQQKPLTEELGVNELVEVFKDEFKTYQNIIQIGESVETGLKLLEHKQAGRLQTLRSLIRKNLDGKTSEQTLVPNPANIDLIVGDCKEKLKECLKTSDSIAHSLVLDSSTTLVSSQNVLDKDVKPDVSSLNCQKELSDDMLIKILLNQKCSNCGKKAMAACQRCKKAFYCSDECGKMYWSNGHVKECK